MNAFTFERLSRPADAASAVAARPGAMFLAGGTTMVDLMKVDVLTPDTVVDVLPGSVRWMWQRPRQIGRKVAAVICSRTCAITITVAP